MMRRPKIMIVDPWGKGSQYLRGLVSGLTRCVDLTVVTSHSFVFPDSTEYRIRRLFFRRSDSMKDSVFRKAVRGVEYISALKDIVDICKAERFDYVHIQWMLLYKADLPFVDALKQLGVKVVYTAHNAIPHVGAESAMNDLEQIYSTVDRIIVHGESIKKELLSCFPDIDSEKVFIQPFGTYSNERTDFVVSAINPKLKSFVEESDRLFAIVGNQFYGKGSDRVLSYWLKRIKSGREDRLVLAGKTRESFTELTQCVDALKGDSSFMYMDGFVDRNDLNYIVSSSSAVLVPYRHASMSAVVFEAAQFSKTVLATNVGAIGEYLEPAQDSIVVDNEDAAYCAGMDRLLSLSDEELRNMGRILHENVKNKYDWNSIGRLLVEFVYV